MAQPKGLSPAAREAVLFGDGPDDVELPAKSGRGWIVALVVALIGVLGVIGYIILDRLEMLPF